MHLHHLYTGITKVWKYDYNYTRTTITKQEKLCNFISVGQKSLLCLIKNRALQEYGRVEVQSRALSAIELYRGKWSKRLAQKKKEIEREKTTPAGNRIQAQFFQIVNTYFTPIFSSKNFTRHLVSL